MLRAEVGAGANERSCLRSFTSGRENIWLGFVKDLLYCLGQIISEQNLYFSLPLTLLIAPLFSEIYLKRLRLLDLERVPVELLAAEQEFLSPVSQDRSGMRCALCSLLQSQQEPPHSAAGIPAAEHSLCSTSQSARGWGEQSSTRPGLHSGC